MAGSHERSKLPLSTGEVDAAQRRRQPAPVPAASEFLTSLFNSCMPVLPEGRLLFASHDAVVDASVTDQEQSARARYEHRGFVQRVP